MMIERCVGKTPHGGVESITMFMDEHGRICDESDAVCYNYIEIDKSGNTIMCPECIMDDNLISKFGNASIGDC